MNENVHEKKIPAVGQRWRDCDPRQKGEREIVIYQKSTCSDVPRFWCNVYKNGVATGRKVHVLESRFGKSSGYSYVGEGVP